MALSPGKVESLIPGLIKGYTSLILRTFACHSRGINGASKKMVLKSVYHILWTRFFGKVISIVLNILSLNGPNIRGKFVSSITACSGGHIQNDVFIR